jgi:HK97 family phage prohead protease
MSAASIVEQRSASTRMIVEENDTGKRVLRGEPIVFNSLSHVLFDPFIGRFREMIMPEAVDRTLRSAASVKALWNHNSDLVLGNTRSGTLALRKGTTALSMEIRPPAWAAPQVETVERGDVDGMSFAFGVTDGGETWEDGEDGIALRKVFDMTFKEVSIVAFPAYPETNVQVSQRSLDVFKESVKGSRIDWLRKVHQTRLAR